MIKAALREMIQTVTACVVVVGGGVRVGGAGVRVLPLLHSA